MSASPPPSPARPVSAIILSAGRSKRMGSEKALLRFGTETALARMLRVLREARVEQIVLVLNRDVAPIERAVHLEGLTTVVNPAAERGQTSSIRVGTRNLSSHCRSFLLCPVDQPLFDARDIEELVTGLEQAPAEISIVAPSVGGRRGHPVLLRRELALEFQALADDTPAHAVIRRDPGRVLDRVSDNIELITDLDSPEAYEQALKRRS